MQGSNWVPLKSLQGTMSELRRPHLQTSMQTNDAKHFEHCDTKLPQSFKSNLFKRLITKNLTAMRRTYDRFLSRLFKLCSLTSELTSVRTSLCRD